MTGGNFLGKGENGNGFPAREVWFFGRSVLKRKQMHVTGQNLLEMRSVKLRLVLHFSFFSFFLFPCLCLS